MRIALFFRPIPAMPGWDISLRYIADREHPGDVQIDGFIQILNNGLKARQSVPGKKGFLCFVQKINSVGLSLADLKYLSLDSEGHYILDIDKLLKG